MIYEQRMMTATDVVIKKFDLDKIDLSVYSLEELVALHLKLLKKLEQEAYEEIKAIKLQQEKKELKNLRRE